MATEIACVNIRDHLTSVLVRGQELSVEVVERKRLGTSYLDCAVHQRLDCKIDQGRMRYRHYLEQDQIRNASRSRSMIKGGQEDVISGATDLSSPPLSFLSRLRQGFRLRTESLAGDV
jgi:hypothetical protein